MIVSNARRSYALAFASALVLANCSGNSSSMPTHDGGLPSVSPTPRPTPTRSPGPLHPADVGDGFAFAGTMTRGSIYSDAVPSPFPNEDASYVVTQNARVSASPPPAGLPASVDYHTSRTESGSLYAKTIDDDSWIAADGTGSTTLVASRSTQASGLATAPYTIAIRYAHPQLLDRGAQIAGTTWTNAPGATIAESGDGFTATRTIADDGSYVENDVLPDGSVATLTEHADGSGTYTAQDAFRPVSQELQVPVVGFALDAPATTTVGIGGRPYLFVNYLLGAIDPNFYKLPYHSVLDTGFPSWYPVTPILHHESDTQIGLVTVPSACQLDPRFGTAAYGVVRAVEHLDTILGSDETLLSTTYSAPGFGTVCVRLSDVTKWYYDYSLARSVEPIFSSSALETVTTSEVATLQSESLVASQHLGRSRARLAAGVAHFVLQLETNRFTHLERTLRALASRKKDHAK